MDPEMTNSFRWNPYVLFNNEKVNDFWKGRYSNPDHKVLFILGKGFDVRMNIGLSTLLAQNPGVDLTCFLIEFDEGSGSSSNLYKHLTEENFAELTTLINGKTVVKKGIKLWNSTGRKRRRIGDRKASDLFQTFESIKNYTDVIVDISSLPRGVYFSLIGKLISLIDHSEKNPRTNLFVCTAENAAIDSLIIEDDPDEDLNFLHGFGGQIELTSELEKPLIWFPILGEDKKPHIRRAFSKITETKNRLFEICPTLPFPSKNPRRSDSLLIDYHSILFDEFNIEPQNIMYIPEQNPFEAYVQLSRALRNYSKSLQVINGCKAVISTFSSKLLSIGTLLSAYEHIENVGVLNVDTQGYKIEDEVKVKKLKPQSELYVSWLTGEPYS
jgi:hypothetical protein